MQLVNKELLTNIFIYECLLHMFTFRWLTMITEARDTLIGKLLAAFKLPVCYFSRLYNFVYSYCFNICIAIGVQNV